MPEIHGSAAVDAEEPGSGRHLSLSFGSYAGVPTAALFVGDSAEPILLPVAFLVEAIRQTATCERMGCIGESIGSFSADGHEEMLLCDAHAHELLTDLFPGEVARWIVGRDGILHSEIDVGGI